MIRRLGEIRESVRGQRGFSYVELLVACLILMVLASAIIPLARWDQKRRHEVHLRTHLRMMREAIDLYKKYTDEGLIVLEDVDQMGYPLTLEELVEGVEVGDPNSPDARVLRFLHHIPDDPFTGKPDWGIRSYQDDWDSTSWGGENVYDVYSSSRGIALDGTYYAEW